MQPLIIYLVAHLLMDYVYLSLAGNSYVNQVRRLLKNQTDPKNKYLYMTLAYVPFLAATYYIIFLPAYKHEQSLESLMLKAALYGASVYAVFNFTNMFMINGYPLANALIDLTYGIVSMLLLVLLAWHARNW